MDLTVLGTKFNFRNYADDEEVVVNLLEGKVKLKNELIASDDIYMCPNEKAVLSKETGVIVKSKMNASNSNLWTKMNCILMNYCLKISLNSYQEVLM